MMRYLAIFSSIRCQLTISFLNICCCTTFNSLNLSVIPPSFFFCCPTCSPLSTLKKKAKGKMPCKILSASSSSCGIGRGNLALEASLAYEGESKAATARVPWK